jgi:hypothetical protein
LFQLRATANPAGGDAGGHNPLVISRLPGQRIHQVVPDDGGVEAGTDAAEGVQLNWFLLSSRHRGWLVGGIFRQTVDASVEADWIDSFWNWNYGFADPGNWAIGFYRVDIYLEGLGSDGQLRASEQFEIY